MGRIILEDGSQYLPVKFRISEFYQKYPKGKIRTSLMRFDRQNNNPGFVESVLIKAEVYRDDATLLAEAYSQRRCEPQEPSFFECAETVAIGRALSDAGYSVYSEDLGDDPCKRKIMLDDGSFYLKAGFRIAWARREMPQMLIRKEILLMTPYQAIVKATIENEGEVLATAHAMRVWSDAHAAGHFFLESAETAAVARALSMIGYDLPPEESHEWDEHDNYSEAPVSADCYTQQDGAEALPELGTGLSAPYCQTGMMSCQDSGQNPIMVGNTAVYTRVQYDTENCNGGFGGGENYEPGYGR
ncbi:MULTISPECIES: hypothetical protein [Clostridia]|uniref:hypothetical protein n=1 Tax=Clostridia TaxID=186801 RepID=UPI000E53C176|nr:MULTISPECIES: hypothetical protein [Clostridia]RHV71179.1 hypothetical protein DXB15_04535 [Roseburia sp. OM02-15]